MDELTEWRAARRTELLASRQAVPNAQRARWSEAIMARLRVALPAVRGLVVGGYMPFRGEPDLRPLFDEWRAAGADTALPVVTGRGQAMEFRSYWPGCPVIKGALSLPMPDGTPLVTPQVVLMPPVGFDAEGYRLGYGGGYFDRTLAILQPAPIKIGVAFELSRMPSIAPQSYDIPMDFIVTERAFHERRSGQLHTLDSDADIGRALAMRRTLAARDTEGMVDCASSPCYAADFDPASST